MQENITQEIHENTNKDTTIVQKKQWVSPAMEEIIISGKGTSFAETASGVPS